MVTISSNSVIYLIPSDTFDPLEEKIYIHKIQSLLVGVDKKKIPTSRIRPFLSFINNSLTQSNRFHKNFIERGKK